MGGFLDSISRLFGGGQQQQQPGLTYNSGSIAPGTPITFGPSQPVNVPQAISSGGLTVNSYGSGVLGTQSPQPVSRPTSGGYTAPPAPTNNYEDMLRRQYDERLRGAQNTFNQTSTALRSNLDSLGREKDSILDRIGSTYNNVRQTAKDTLARNLGALETGKKDVQTGYAGQKSEQARLLKDTELKNRMTARSLGNANSGWFQNLQSKAGNIAQQNIGSLGQQEQSQLDRIGNEIVFQNTDANTKLRSLDETEAAAKSDVLNKYQTAFNQIQNQLGFNEMDKADAVENINNALRSSLDQIAMTMGTYKQYAGQLGGVVNPVADATPVAQSLARVAPTVTAQMPVAPPVATQSPLSYADLIGRLMGRDEERRGYA